MEEEPMPTRRLDLRVRRVAAGNGAVAASPTVFCPTQARSVALEECTECRYCDGVTIDPADRDSFLVCRRPANGEPVAAVAVNQPHGASDYTPISEVMSKAVFCLKKNKSAEALLATFLERGISGVPVVDGEGHPMGVASKTDLL